jgi:hypothetical protein
MLYKKSTKMYSTLYIALIIFLSLFSNIAFATYTIFDNVNITKNLTVAGLNAADCDVKANTSGFLSCGTDATGASGVANYWQNSTTWMWPNTTAGGKTSVNVTTLNATTVNQNGYKVLDISGSVNIGNITDPTDCTAAQKVTGKTGSSWDCGTDLFNTSSEIWLVIDNNTYHKFSQTINWNNLSSWNLNVLWTGTLGGGNITTGTVTSTQIADGTIATADLATAFAINFGNISAGWDLNKLWSNSLGGGNITAGTITSAKLANDLALGWGNLSFYPTACTAGNAISALLDIPTCSPFQTGSEVWNTSAEMTAAVNATANAYFQIKVNDSVNLNGKAASYYLNTGGGITFSNITDIANCSVGYYVNGRVGNAWVCAADVSGGGSGANYWQTSGSWMWPNVTAGGQNNINLTTVNSTTFYQNGNKVLDVSGGLTWGNISSGWSLNQAWAGSLGWGNLTGYDLNKAWANTLGGANITTGTITSTQIADGTIATADLASGFSINWGNVTGYNLNVAWTGSLGWGNLTGYDLNKAWANSLGAGNLTAGTLTNASLSSTFKILLGNVTDVANCTSAQKVLGKVNSAWVCDTDLFNTSTQMDAAINATANRYFQLKVNESVFLNGKADTYYLNTGGFNAGNLTSGTISNIAIVSNQWVNTSTGVNASKIYSPLVCGDQACTHNITYNGTNWIIYG